jgi:dTDP-4-dehydrorhamnose reductase
MSERVVVCGSSGILGKNLCRQLGGGVLAPTRNDIDYMSLQSIKNFFEKNKSIKVCINCIAERRLENCESDWENTKSTNITIPSNLYNVCILLGIHFVHISTDYVFDGKNPPYSPTFSRPNPLQNYGISKLIAEYALGSDATIIRVPVLYSEEGNDLIEPLLKKVMSHEKSFEDNYFPRRPVYIPDFCTFIIDIAVHKKEKGTFHFWNPLGVYTKYQIIQMIGKILNKDVSHVSPSENKYTAGRPYDTLFIDEKYDIYSYKHTPLCEGLLKILSPYFSQ